MITAYFQRATADAAGAAEMAKEDCTQEVGPSHIGDRSGDSSCSDESDEEEERKHGISGYELQRQRNIERNRAFLASIGLEAIQPQFEAPKPRRKRPRPEPIARESPQRRSRRLEGKIGEADAKGSVQSTTGTSDAPGKELEEPTLESLVEIDYNDSGVLSYACADRIERAEAATERGLARLVQQQEERLVALGLTAIYSMDWRGQLLAAAGKGGKVAVFATQAPASSGDNLVFSFKAHSGWVSAVQFVLSAEAAGTCRLLTSGNDGAVSLWDATAKHNGAPRLLASTSTIHGRKGIFAMHALGELVGTGGKDRSAAVSCLTPSGVVRRQTISSSGGGVVKDVRLRDAATLAWCGDDRAVRVSDLRRPEAGAAAAAVVFAREDAHDGGMTHTVRWHPTNEHLLMTAGLDPVVRLWDLRKPAGKAVMEMCGHVPFLLKKPKGIHRPEFVAGGSGVITSGERSSCLTLFNVSDEGKLASRGEIGTEVTTVAIEGPRVAAACPGGNVFLLSLAG